ncbi:MAG: membrane protein [Rhodothermaceae bacterium]|nr:MAG: membrane protein [Rhodothermaceae bacterium]
MRHYLWIGAVAAGLAVAAGAFGAHGLAGRLTAERLQTFETAVRYQMYHALALLVVGWMGQALAVWQLQAAGALFTAGIVLFSGSLYVLVLTDTPWLGAVTPFGGVAFLMGWAMVVWATVARTP